jgi:hypothetical protein
METPKTTPQFPGASDDVPQTSAEFGKVPHRSEDFRTVPKTSEAFRSIPNGSEPFGKFPNNSEAFQNERKQSHTITVRDAARMFEESGVARTERSIVNWCQRDAAGTARLDADFDPNERRYYITEESIVRAIAEEKAKAFRTLQNGGEPIPRRSEAANKDFGNPDGPSSSDSNTLKKELLDLQILNAGKDIVIKQLREERGQFIQQMMDGSRKIGELETRLLQLDEPLERKLRVRPSLPNDSEAFGI